MYYEKQVTEETYNMSPSTRSLQIRKTKNKTEQNIQGYAYIL